MPSGTAGSCSKPPMAAEILLPVAALEKPQEIGATRCWSH